MKRLLSLAITILAVLSISVLNVNTAFGIEPPSGDGVADYGIAYTAPTEGNVRWYASHIRHYPVGTNDWRHNLYVSTYNWTGWPNTPETHEWALHVPQTNVPIICWWSGEDTPYPLPADYVILHTWTEKPPSEPGCNFPMEMNATYRVAVYTGEPGTSSIVSNIHTRHPDEGEDVTQGHHSFDVYFTAVESAEPTARPTPTPAPTWTVTLTPAPTFTAIPTKTPVVVDVAAMIREESWNEWLGEGHYNPDATFTVYARENELGVPLSGEFDVGDYRVQGFAGMILYARIGDWANVKGVAW